MKATINEFMNEKLAALCQKWIEEERRLRAYPGPITSYAVGRADQLAKCRRELQEAAGLVLLIDEVDDLDSNRR